MANAGISSAHYVDVSEHTVTSWKTYATNCFNLLSNYNFLTDSYVLDFFSEDLWQGIPPQWGESLQSFSPQQLSALLHPPSSHPSQSNRIGAVLPLSLLAFRSAAFAYALPREAVTSPSALLEYMKKRCPVSNWNSDVEGAINCLHSFVPPSNHINSAYNKSNHICSGSPETVPFKNMCSSSTATNCSEKLSNEYLKMTLCKEQNHLSKSSDLHYSSKEEFICDKVNELYKLAGDPSNDNCNHTVNNVGNVETELYFEENKRKTAPNTKFPHYLVNNFMKTEGIFNQEKRNSTELSSLSSSERTLGTEEHMDLESKRRWTSNNNQDLVPAWPATNVDSIAWGTSDSELSEAGGQHRLLSHVFRRHVKPKKQHEVARLALIASLASAATHCDVTSDVGSGCGHLARLMAYGHRLRVVCVDKEEDFVKGARQFDDQLEKSMSKLKPRHSPSGQSRSNMQPQQQQQLGKEEKYQYQLPAGPRHAACLLRLGGDVHTFSQFCLAGRIFPLRIPASTLPNWLALKQQLPMTLMLSTV